jgi:hypothetical protein
VRVMSWFWWAALLIVLADFVHRLVTGRKW